MAVTTEEELELVWPRPTPHSVLRYAVVMALCSGFGVHAMLWSAFSGQWLFAALWLAYALGTARLALHWAGRLFWLFDLIAEEHRRGS